MSYRRGFKTEANDIAREIRSELGLGPLAPLDPRTLAAWLEIPILPLSEMVAKAPAVAHLLTKEQNVFSAVTVFRGTRRNIVHNDSHALVRQNSNLAHEISHGLLHHPPTPALDNNGCRDWNQDIEDEAQWLAGALLVTEDAALAIARAGMPLATAAQRFQVSEPMIRFRLNMTGAQRRVQRARGARAGTRRR
jgi:Zn-dependent peptidase ImmA (M78 family)